MNFIGEKKSFINVIETKRSILLINVFIHNNCCCKTCVIQVWFNHNICKLQATAVVLRKKIIPHVSVLCD